jgi:hypothetical protein
MARSQRGRSSADFIINTVGYSFQQGHWANESFAIAEQAQTKYCIRLGASCDQPMGKVTIDAAYVVANTPIIQEQLQKAGIRLAHLLDATLGK